jgi:hypothetical protein
MPRIGKNPDHDFCAGYARSQTDRSELELQGLASGSWGKPLNYGELLTDPFVQSRIAQLIAQSAIKRPCCRW